MVRVNKKIRFLQENPGVGWAIITRALTGWSRLGVSWGANLYMEVASCLSVPSPKGGYV